MNVAIWKKKKSQVIRLKLHSMSMLVIKDQCLNIFLMFLGLIKYLRHINHCLEMSCFACMPWQAVTDREEASEASGTLETNSQAINEQTRKLSAVSRLMWKEFQGVGESGQGYRAMRNRMWWGQRETERKRLHLISQSFIFNTRQVLLFSLWSFPT